MTHPRAALPDLPRPVAPHLPPLRSFRLDNGLELLVVERGELPVVDARLLIRAGAAHDDVRFAGRAALTADLLDEGTATRSALAIADEAEHLGASLQTRASWDFTVAGLHVLSSRLEPAVELLADVVLRPSFPQAEVERKRTERLAAIVQEQDEPRIVANSTFARVLYGSAVTYGVPVGGTRATVELLERDAIHSFYSGRYSPSSAFLVMVGDLRAAAACELVNRLFDGWRGAPAAPPVDAVLSPAPPTAIWIVDRPGAPQSEVRIGTAGPPRQTRDFFPLLVGNTVLGGAFTSRLNIRLREEKAYTYGAASHFAFRAGGGPFSASTAVFTGATADAVQIIVHEVARLGREPIEPAELERARNNLVLGLPRTFETTGDIAEHVSEVALYELGRDFFDTYAANVGGVSAEDVMSAAARWLRPDHLAIVVVGDANAIATELESLDLGNVEVIDGS